MKGNLHDACGRKPSSMDASVFIKHVNTLLQEVNDPLEVTKYVFE
jgi:hypothetical protein